MAKIAEWINDQTRKLVNEKLKQLKNKFSKTPPDSDFIKLNADRTKGVLTDGREVNILFSGTPRNIELGFRIDDNNYFVQGQQFKHSQVDSSISGFLLYKIQQTSAGHPVFYYIKKLSDGDTIDTLYNVLANERLGLDFTNFNTLRTVQFSPNGKHILIGAYKTSFNVLNFLTIQWAIIKNFKLIEVDGEKIVDGEIETGQYIINEDQFTKAQTPVPPDLPPSLTVEEVDNNILPSNYALGFILETYTLSYIRTYIEETNNLWLRDNITSFFLFTNNLFIFTNDANGNPIIDIAGSYESTVTKELRYRVETEQSTSFSTFHHRESLPSCTGFLPDVLLQESVTKNCTYLDTDPARPFICGDSELSGSCFGFTNTPFPCTVTNNKRSDSSVSGSIETVNLNYAGNEADFDSCFNSHVCGCGISTCTDSCVAWTGTTVDYPPCNGNTNSNPQNLYSLAAQNAVQGIYVIKNINIDPFIDSLITYDKTFKDKVTIDVETTTHNFSFEDTDVCGNVGTFVFTGSKSVDVPTVEGNGIIIDNLGNSLDGLSIVTGFKSAQGNSAALWELFPNLDQTDRYYTPYLEYTGQSFDNFESMVATDQHVWLRSELEPIIPTSFNIKPITSLTILTREHLNNGRIKLQFYKFFSGSINKGGSVTGKLLSDLSYQLIDYAVR